MSNQCSLIQHTSWSYSAALSGSTLCVYQCMITQPDCKLSYCQLNVQSETQTLRQWVFGSYIIYLWHFILRSWPKSRVLKFICYDMEMNANVHVQGIKLKPKTQVQNICWNRSMHPSRISSWVHPGEDRQLFTFTPTWVGDSNLGSVLTTVPTCYHYVETYILIK